MLARMQGILGAWPSWMLEEDKNKTLKKDNSEEVRFIHKYRRRLIYQMAKNETQVTIVRLRWTS